MEKLATKSGTVLIEVGVSFPTSAIRKWDAGSEGFKSGFNNSPT